VILIKPGAKRKVYRFAADHDLCSQCWKSLRDKSRAAEIRKNKNG
jgi:hypothetical protein